MALTDFLGQSTNLFNNGDPQDQNIDLGVLSQIVNSQPQSQPQQAPVQAQEAPAQESGGVGGFLKGIADGLTGALSNPETINALQAFSSGLSGNAQAQAQYTNAYSQRVAERKDQERQEVYRKEQQRIAEESAQRQSQNQFTSQLFKQYTPESVQAFQQSGDYSVLKPVQKAASYSSAGDGYILNSATGEVTRGYTPDVKATGAGSRGGKVSTAVSSDGQGGVVLGDGVTRVTAPGRYVDQNGTSYVAELTTRGLKVSPVSVKDQTSLNSNGPTATQTQMNSDLKTLSGAIDNGNVDSFTGQVVGRVDQAGDVASSVAGGESRDAYLAAQRIDGMMLSQGVADAKSMGASGINTAAEAQMYFKGMPRLDRTSPEALRRSIQNIQSYTTNFNAQKKSNSTVPQVRSSAQEAPVQQAPATTSIPQGWSVKVK